MERSARGIHSREITSVLLWRSHSIRLRISQRGLQHHCIWLVWVTEDHIGTCRKCHWAMGRTIPHRTLAQPSWMFMIISIGVMPYNYRDWYNTVYTSIKTLFLFISHLKKYEMLHKFTCCPCTRAMLIFSVSFKFLVYVLEVSTTFFLFNILILPQVSTVSSKTFSDLRVAVRARVSHPDVSENLTSPQTSYNSVRVMVVVLQMGKLR